MVIKNFIPKNVWVLAGLLPLLAMLVLVIRYSVNVPVTDQYEFIPIFNHLDHGHIVFNDFWAQHNEHRVVFPTIILVLLATITHWNILAEIYLSFLIACIGFWGLVSLIRRHVQNNKLKAAVVFISSAIFFSPVQWENWIWGWQLEWFLCITCIIWSINFIDKIKKHDRKSKIIPALVLAVVTTFSLGSGSLVWFAGLLILIIKRMKKIFTITWLAAMLTSLGLYYFNYHKPQNGLSPTSFLHDLPHFVEYYLAYIGRPISDNPHIAIFVGIYITIAYFGLLAFAVYRKRFGQIIVPVSIGLLAFGAGILTSVARFDYGIAGAMSSRYTAFSNLIIISLVMSVAFLLVAEKKKNINIEIIMMVAVLLPSIFYGWRNGINGIRGRSQLYTYIYECSHEVKPTEACLYEIYFPSTVEAKQRLDYLKQKHYGGY